MHLAHTRCAAQAQLLLPMLLRACCAALLTEMHWSIPRPLSIAEQQLQADLDVADLARRDTAAKWAALRWGEGFVISGCELPCVDF